MLPVTLFAGDTIKGFFGSDQEAVGQGDGGGDDPLFHVNPGNDFEVAIQF